jgi:hypothetical protein
MSQAREIGPEQRHAVTPLVIDHIKSPNAAAQPHNFNNTPDNATPFRAYKDSIYQKIMYARADHIDHEGYGIESNFLAIKKQAFWLRRVNHLFAEDDNAKEKRAKQFLLNYARLTYAYFSASLSLLELLKLKRHCDQEKILEKIAALDAAMGKSFDSIMKDGEKSVAACEAKILELIGDTKWQLIELIDTALANIDLSQLGFTGTREEIINKMLDQAKDWIGLEQPTLPIYTLFEVPQDQLSTGDKSKRFLIVDEPCTALTEQQKIMLKEREGAEWFYTLSPFQQKMIDYYAGVILEDNRVLPSQLRSVLPAGRNAYRQAIYIEDEGGNFVQEGECYHAGTAAYLRHDNDKVALAATTENLLQQKINSDVRVSVMIALNSQLADTVVGAYKRARGQKYDRDDSKIIELTAKAASEGICQVMQVYYSKLCLNGFRNFEFNEYSGINNILLCIGANIGILEQTYDLTDSEQLVIAEMKAHTEKVKVLAATKIWNDSGIKGTDILYHLTRAATLSNRLVEMHKTKSDRLFKVAVWIGCASGENRTGLAYFHILRQTLVDYYQRNGVEIDDAVVAQISNVIADSQHVHILTGGTFGTEGIRGKSAGSAKPYDPKDKLVTNVADMKAIRPCHIPLKNAIAKLRHAIQTKFNDATVEDLLPYAINLHQYAQELESKFFTLGLSKADRAMFVTSLQVATAVLEDPSIENISSVGQLYGTLTKASNSNALHPALKNDSNRSIKFTVLGCLLGIASAAVAALSVAALIGTGGTAIPLAALGLAFASTLAKAAAATIAVSACTTFVAGTLFYNYGRHQHKNVHRNLYKLYEAGLAKLEPKNALRVDNDMLQHQPRYLGIVKL